MKTSNYFENKKTINFGFKLSTEIETKITDWKQNNTFFGVFPIKGDSMTCDDLAKSIPNGSKVLAYDLEIDCNKTLDEVWYKIPIREVVLITGETNTGEKFNLCKTINFVNAHDGYVVIKSHNENYKDQCIPFTWIKSIFKVVQIIQ
ncbi:MAG TPA: hypothetical protein VIV55_06590 [Flavobacterium sp.]